MTPQEHLRLKAMFNELNSRSNSSLVEDTAERISTSYRQAVIDLAQAVDHIARIYQAGCIVKDKVQTPLQGFDPDGDVTLSALNIMTTLFNTFVHEVRSYISEELACFGLTFEDIIEDPEAEHRHQVPGGLEVLAIMFADSSTHQNDPVPDFTAQALNVTKAVYLDTIRQGFKDVKTITSFLN